MAAHFLRNRFVHMIPMLAALLFSSTAGAQTLSAPVQEQTSSVQLRELVDAVAAERQALATMRAELERRSTALADLASRLESLAPTAAPSPLTVPPPEQATKVSPEAASSPALAVPRFDFYGDTKVRYETLTQDYPDCIACPNRKRGRLRLRFGVEGRLSPDFKAVMGLSVGELNDPNSVYVNLGNKFSRKVATWDRGYVEYHPAKAPWLDLTAGKFPYTWIRSSMVFDVDFYPEGLSEKLSFDLKHAGPVKNVGVQGFQILVSEQAGDLHTKMIGEQITGRFRINDRISTMLAVTAVDITRPDPLLRSLLDGSDVGVRNTNAVVMRNGQAFYASGFRYANLIVENAVKTPSAAWPLTLAVEFQRNLEAASSLDSAESFRIDLGRAHQRGDWGLSWHIFRVEQDAILASFGESDWRAPSNVFQQRFEVNRMVSPNVQLGVTLYRGRTLDGTLQGALLAPNLAPSLLDPWMNRFYFDVTYRY